MATLEAGKYFWRIADKGAPLTEVSQFRISGAIALKPSFPAGGQKVTTWEQDTTAQFRWLVPQNQDIQDALSLSQVTHKIEIARDVEFKTVLLTQDINAISGVANLKDIPPGQAFWRIRSQYGDVAVNGPVEKFTMESAQKLALELGKPDEQGALELQAQIKFNWICEATNVEYQLEVQKAEGNESVVSVKGRALNYVWKNPVAGNYKWRVVGLNQQRPVGETPWRNFTIFSGAPIKLAVPAKNQELYWWDKAKPFEFEWKSDSLGAEQGYSYIIEVGKDAELKSGVTVQRSAKATFNSEAFNFPPNGLNGDLNYYWRVKLVDAQNRVTKVSEIQKFAHGMHPLLKAATTATPEPGYTRNMVTENGDLQFTWSEVEEAEGYELLIFDSAETSRNLASGETPVKVIHKQQVDSNKALIKSDQLKTLPAGNYKWTVRATDKLKRKGAPLEPRPITLTYGDLLAPPEVTSPEVQ